MSDAADGPGMRRTFIVPTITSFDHYDFTRAKIKCSLTWLVAKAFGSGRWRFWFSHLLTIRGMFHITGIPVSLLQ